MSIENKYEKNALLTLACFSGFGPVTLKKLYSYFYSWSKALNANYQNLKQLNLNDKLINDFLHFRKTFDIKKIINIINKENIDLLYFKDDNYPPLLKEIPNPPILLFLKGNKKLLKNKKQLSVVGSRKTNQYGIYSANELIPKLNKNIIIVSGLAYGIDSLAHRLALNNQQKTIAVLGSGVDNNSIYPKENQSLANEIIINNGLIISEFPPLSPPLKHHFPQRNRILAGLSMASLVIQAKKKSGALITAYMALDFNREVLTVPANINLQYSQGNNQLIKNGAKVILNYKDIEESLNIDSS